MEDVFICCYVCIVHIIDDILIDSLCGFLYYFPLISTLQMTVEIMLS